MTKLQNAVGIYGSYAIGDPVQHAKSIGSLASTSGALKDELVSRGMTQTARKVVKDDVMLRATLGLDKLIADLDVLADNITATAPTSPYSSEDVGSEHMPHMQSIGSDINRLVTVSAQSVFPKTAKAAMQRAQEMYFSIFRTLYDGGSVYDPDIMTQIVHMRAMAKQARGAF